MCHDTICAIGLLKYSGSLQKKDVKYVIVGGIAVNLLGVPRFTADLDLIVALKQKNMIVFSFWRPDRPYEVIDVFVKEPIPFKELWSKREKVPLENIKIPVISIGHLIRLKKQANRLQDISDIEALKKLLNELRSEKNSKKRG
jgi:predicted nucleotidyltransferase